MCSSLVPRPIQNIGEKRVGLGMRLLCFPDVAEGSHCGGGVKLLSRMPWGGYAYGRVFAEWSQTTPIQRVPEVPSQLGHHTMHILHVGIRLNILDLQNLIYNDYSIREALSP